MTYLEVCCILLEIQVFSRPLSGFGVFLCVCVFKSILFKNILAIFQFF